MKIREKARYTELRNSHRGRKSGLPTRSQQCWLDGYCADLQLLENAVYPASPALSHVAIVNKMVGDQCGDDFIIHFLCLVIRVWLNLLGKHRPPKRFEKSDEG
jgi:hypothetical protein